MATGLENPPHRSYTTPFPPRTKGKEGSILLQGKQLPMRWDTPGGDAWLGAAGADRAAPTAASLPATSPAGAQEDAVPP